MKNDFIKYFIEVKSINDLDNFNTGWGSPEDKVLFDSIKTNSVENPDDVREFLNKKINIKCIDEIESIENTHFDDIVKMKSVVDKVDYSLEKVGDNNKELINKKLYARLAPLLYEGFEYGRFTVDKKSVNEMIKNFTTSLYDNEGIFDIREHLFKFNFEQVKYYTVSFDMSLIKDESPLIKMVNEYTDSVNTTNELFDEINGFKNDIEERIETLSTSLKASLDVKDGDLMLESGSESKGQLATLNSLYDTYTYLSDELLPSISNVYNMKNVEMTMLEIKNFLDSVKRIS